MTTSYVEYNSYYGHECRWNDSYTATSVRIGPDLYRWDAYDVSASASYSETLTEPNGSTGSWSFSKGVSTSGGYSLVDEFGYRTYPKKHSAYTIVLKLGFNAGSAWGGSYHSVSSSATFRLTVPALASYAVSYNANGGTGAPAGQTKWYGESLTLSSAIPAREGYAFAGWATSSSSATAEYPAGASYTGNAALSLYAVWQEITYSISYNANGHGTAPSGQTKKHGFALELRGSMGTQGNHVFKEWNTAADGTGTAYAAGASYTGNADLALYAQWYAPYTITYKPNGATGSDQAQTKVHGEPATVKPANTYSRTDHVFKEWNTAADGTGTAYAAGASYTGNADLALYAQWYAPYTITPNANGGTLASGCSALTKAYNTARALWAQSLEPTRTGYAFTGWNTNASGTGTSYASGGTIPASVNQNVTLYAQWALLHANPTISTLLVQRCQRDGTLADDGTYVKVTAEWSVDTEGGTAGDAAEITLNGTTDTVALSGTSGTIAHIHSTAISINSSYPVTLALADTKGYSSTRSSTVSVAFFTMHFRRGGKGIGIGRPSSSDGLSIGMDTSLYGAFSAYGSSVAISDPAAWMSALGLENMTSAQADAGSATAGMRISPKVLADYVASHQAVPETTPAGMITMFGGSSAPSGWLLCDGSAVSRTAYAALFAVIGTSYGAGDGSTTFNLPNLSGRFALGSSGTHALGTTGGAENVTLTSSEIPAHTHGSRSITGQVGQVLVPSDNGYTSSTLYFEVRDNVAYPSSESGTARRRVIKLNATHEHDSVGGDGAHENMPPYQAVNYIIKA